MFLFFSILILSIFIFVYFYLFIYLVSSGYLWPLDMVKSPISLNLVHVLVFKKTFIFFIFYPEWGDGWWDGWRQMTRRMDGKDDRTPPQMDKTKDII